MGKIFALLRSNIVIFVLLGLSILVLGLGVFLILSSPAEHNDLSPMKSPSTVEQSLIDSLEESESLIIKASKNSGNNQDNAAQDTHRLVRGSEEWCEIMMQKNNNEWNEADTQLFGLKCLN